MNIQMQLAVFLASCPIIGFAEPSTKASEELDIREATFLCQLLGNKSSDEGAKGSRGQTGLCFLAIAFDRKFSDPDDAFMRRFIGIKPRVRKFSESAPSTLKGIVDKNTGESGAGFYTGAIKWVSDVEVEVAGGSFGMSGSGLTFYLKKAEGKWVVIKDEINWIE